jgi:prevent-host-death family protein
MELTVREAKAKFSEALAAVQRGESVVVTKHGRPVAEIVKPVARRGGLNFEAADRYLKERGLDNIKTFWPDYFDDPPIVERHWDSKIEAAARFTRRVWVVLKRELLNESDRHLFADQRVEIFASSASL